MNVPYAGDTGVIHPWHTPLLLQSPPSTPACSDTALVRSVSRPTEPLKPPPAPRLCTLPPPLSPGLPPQLSKQTSHDPLGLALLLCFLHCSLSIRAILCDGNLLVCPVLCSRPSRLPPALRRDADMPDRAAQARHCLDPLLPPQPQLAMGFPVLPWGPCLCFLNVSLSLRLQCLRLDGLKGSPPHSFVGSQFHLLLIPAQSSLPSHACPGRPEPG